MVLRHSLSFLIILCCVISLAQTASSTRISVEKEITSTLDALDHLRESGVDVAFSKDLIPDKEIQIRPGTYTLRQFVNILRDQSSLNFVSEGSIIMVTYSEKKYTISGEISDAHTGEALIGATVIVGTTSVGAVTNKYGFYSLTLPAGEHDLTFRFVGYEVITQTFDLKSNSKFIVKLTPTSETLEEVTIESNSPSYNLENLIPGIQPINFGDKWPIPYFLGEQDIFQNSLTLPGIRSIGEDATGLNVRGGDIDQNLILLDEAPIYNPNHFYGLISVFNPEVVNNVEIMKGHIPARYGGRASSVINIFQREGNNQSFHLSGGIGLVSSRLTAEGPLERGRSSYILSLRRSMLNFSIEDFLNASLDDSRTNFQDINAKVNFKLKNNDRLYISGYYGRDRNRAGFDAVRRWGNRSVTIRYNKIFSPRLFSNFTGIVSEYNYRIQDPQQVGSFIGRSLIRDYSLKSDFGFIINPRHSIDFGIQSTLHHLNPGEREPFDENATTIATSLDAEDALETSVYISHRAELTDKLHIEYGLRNTLLLNIAPGEIYSYLPGQPKTDETIIDTTRYSGRQVFNQDLSWEPRFSINYKINSRQGLKASYSRSFQFIHLISNTVSPAPTDIWKMSDQYIRPTISDHYSIGYYTNSADEKWEMSVEMYTKNLNNVIEFKDGAELLFNENIETELLNGTGLAYGAEFFLKKNSGRFTGWFSYTLSRTEQRFRSKFPELRINDGNSFATDFDKRHDFSLVGIYRISRRVSLSSNLNYSTGRPITLPVGKYVFDGKIVPHFEDRNLFRLPDYHRLDLAVRIAGKTERKGRVRNNRDYWLVTLYNVYARNNIYSYFFRESENNPGETIAIPYSIFNSIIPSVTYNFRF